MPEFVEGNTISGITFLRDTQSDVGAATSLKYTFPVSVPNSIILTVTLQVRGIATVMSNPDRAAMGLLMTSADGAILRVRHSSTFRNVLDTHYYAFYEGMLHYVVGDSLYLYIPEIDTNGTPTADYYLTVELRKMI
jgi:hypothetical protein